MGIVSFSSSPLLSVLLAPVHALAAWFIPGHQASPYAESPRQAVTPVGHRPAVSRINAQLSNGKHTHGSHGNLPRTCNSITRPSRQSRLKIVREFDASVGAASAGRMVITGRMADVCAELDRMARLESPGS